MVLRVEFTSGPQLQCRRVGELPETEFCAPVNVEGFVSNPIDGGAEWLAGNRNGGSDDGGAVDLGQALLGFVDAVVVEESPVVLSPAKLVLLPPAPASCSCLPNSAASEKSLQSPESRLRLP